MHQSDEVVLAWIHGELEPDEASRVAAHAAACPTCADRAASLRQADADFAAMFRTLDQPVPAVPADDLIHRLSRRGRRSVPSLLAAGLATLLFVAGAAAVVSPRFRSTVMAPFQSESPQAEAPVQSPSPGGIEIASLPRVDVVLPAEPVLGTLELRLSDEAVIRLESSAAEVRFEVREGRLFVSDPPAGADFVLTVPRGLAELTVLVGERLVLTKSGDAVDPRPGPTGTTLVALADPAEGRP